MKVPNKYDLVTDIMVLCDELEKSRARTEQLERELSGFKMAVGSGEMPDSMLRVYECGKKYLFDKCFNCYWDDVGVTETSDGRLVASRSLDQWMDKCFASNHLPSDMTKVELFEVCRELAREEYDKKLADEMREFEKDEKDGEDGE